jgi:hypothetical protein
MTQEVQPVKTVKEKEEAEEQLPLAARVINHILTPGSSLTVTVWISFNLIMAVLFLIWLMFVVSFPDDLNVWIFGVLGAGLLGSTNWFMYEVFNAKEDFASLQAKKKLEEEDAGGQQRKMQHGAAAGAKDAGSGKEASPELARMDEKSISKPTQKKAHASPLQSNKKKQ